MVTWTSWLPPPTAAADPSSARLERKKYQTIAPMTARPSRLTKRKAMALASQRNSAQPERVRHHGHRAHGHGGPRQKRRQKPPGSQEGHQHAGGDTDCQDIVEERPQQVLLDVAEGGPGSGNGV